MTEEQLEQQIEMSTREAPPDTCRVIIEAVRSFVANPDGKIMTIAKISGEDRVHYLIDIS